tara:strand:- start:521 stop:760 length:240 start_codon:yes stop_codon:yes gene_type:complete
MFSIDDIIKQDLDKVSQMDSDKIMDLLNLDGEDSAFALQEACKSYIRSDLGKKEKTRKTQFGGFGRKSARTVIRGGGQW